MKVINPTHIVFDEGARTTPVKFDDSFKKALQEFANKHEFGNLSAVVKKATASYIGFTPRGRDHG